MHCVCGFRVVKFRHGRLGMGVFPYHISLLSPGCLASKQALLVGSKNCFFCRIKRDAPIVKQGTPCLAASSCCCCDATALPCLSTGCCQCMHLDGSMKTAAMLGLPFAMHTCRCSHWHRAERMFVLVRRQHHTQLWQSLCLNYKVW